MKLDSSDLTLLKEIRSNTRDKRIFVRCSTIIAHEAGLSHESIAISLDIGMRSVSRYIQIFEQEGIDGLVEFKYTGRQQQLNPNQLHILNEELKENLYTSTEQIQAFIKTQWGIEYSRSGVRDLLHRLKYVYKKIKIVPGKADGKAQEQFIIDVEEVFECLTEDEAAFYLDGSHPTHNTRPAYGWIRKGKEFTIRANTGRKRVNLNGAVNALDPTEVYVHSSDSVNAQSTQQLIEQILAQNPDKKAIYLISDNARYYHARLLQDWLEDYPQIVWIWLPTYSPNLNLIERLWGFMQRKILNGVYYDTYSKFKQAIHSFFENIDQYEQELKSLMTLNFQIIDWNQSAKS